MLALLLLPQADASGEVLDALRRTRAEAGYTAAFKGGGGAAGTWIDKSGRARRPAAGLLLLEVQATGRREKVPAVRVGNRTWVYSRIHQKWMAPDEANETGIAHGLANPDELLTLIGDHARFARKEGKDLELIVKGADALALAKKLAGDQGWTDADAVIRLARDADGRFSSVAVRASATSPQGKAKLEAGVDLTYGKVEIPDRLDGVDIDPGVKAAIEAHLRR